MILLALDWGLLGEKLTLVIIIVSVSLLIAMYETYAERKIAAFIQDRIGPDRAGPFGILQPLADGLKLFIHDNGKGIDFEKLRQFGNGLKNMKKRMEDIGIQFSIENNNGTLVTLYRVIEDVNFSA